MSPEVIAAIIAASVSFLTLLGTLAAQYFGRRATSRDLEEQRKQLDRTLAEQRTQTLNERFVTAAGQLGGDKPPQVRLAGVYAMAGLADDWEENRQACVDVLSGYLRMPYEPAPGQDAPGPERLAFRASREVRHTLMRLIGAHLRSGAGVSWQGLNFDFTGVVFDGGDFRAAEFSGGEVLFTDAEFAGGEILFDDAEFSGGMVDFTGARFSGGTVSFHSARFSGGTARFDAEFSGSTVIFTNAAFSDGMVDFSGARFSGGQISFSLARFSGGIVSFHGARLVGGTVSFDDARFSDDRVSFSGAEFTGSQVSFHSAAFSGGRVSFVDAGFSGGTVSFHGAAFSGGQVTFYDAQFSGGTVDFCGPGDWSFPPTFPWTDTPPPGVKLPVKGDQSQT
jgi:uncharacterized protein YjbI with pentapeptide repeats